MSGPIASRVQAQESAVCRLLRAAGARLAYVFGSVASGQERADSDLDIAVLLDPGTPPDERSRLQLHLTTELVGLVHVNDVDVVILNDAPPLLAFVVVSTGRLILGTELDRVRYETRAIQELIDTRPLREAQERELDEHIAARGAKPPRSAGAW